MTTCLHTVLSRSSLHLSRFLEYLYFRSPLVLSYSWLSSLESFIVCAAALPLSGEHMLRFESKRGATPFHSETEPETRATDRDPIARKQSGLCLASKAGIDRNDNEALSSSWQQRQIAIDKVCSRPRLLLSPYDHLLALPLFSFSSVGRRLRAGLVFVIRNRVIILWVA